jgi:arsenate reductase
MLISLADHIRKRRTDMDSAQLIFICTHNSRRSHMSQLWAELAAWYHGVDRVECFSGGTEATAFNPSAVKAMKEAGMSIVARDDSPNPRYEVRFREGMEPLVVFSKKYSDPPNPTSGFIAVMTCSDADEACPIVYGSSSRVTLTYEDPKLFDGTGEEDERYSERCSQIAREMLFLFSRVGVT